MKRARSLLLTAADWLVTLIALPVVVLWVFCLVVLMLLTGCSAKLDELSR